MQSGQNVFLSGVFDCNRRSILACACANCFWRFKTLTTPLRASKFLPSSVKAFSYNLELSANFFRLQATFARLTIAADEFGECLRFPVNRFSLRLNFPSSRFAKPRAESARTRSSFQILCADIAHVGNGVFHRFEQFICHDEARFPLRRRQSSPEFSTICAFR